MLNVNLSERKHTCDFHRFFECNNADVVFSSVGIEIRVLCDGGVGCLSTLNPNVIQNQILRPKNHLYLLDPDE